MDKKFDVVIGNPPYQDEAIGEATSAPPIYPMFMNAAYEVGEKAVLITPARFLFNAGYTSKAWNEEMLNDPHLYVPIYVPDSGDLFPGTDIEGGIAVTYRDETRELGPIGTFSGYKKLRTILKKVQSIGEDSFGPLVTKRDAYRYTQTMHHDNPRASSLMSRSSKFIVNSNAFAKLPFLYYEEPPEGSTNYVRVFGLHGKNRTYRWIRGEYITGPENFSGYKIVIPKSRGHLGMLGAKPALMIGEPFLAEPDVAVTQSFLTIGNFENRREAEACFKYVKSKFARTMLAVLKVTQDNPARVWEHVPLQDFTNDSDIDWSKSVAEIDQQLYAKYGLDDEEVEFIETHLKPMDEQ